MFCDFVILNDCLGVRASLSAKRMLTHSLFSFWATPKTASREGLKRQELALVSGKHSLGAGVAKQREKSDKSATHRFARAPRRAEREKAREAWLIPERQFDARSRQLIKKRGRAANARPQFPFL